MWSAHVHVYTQGSERNQLRYMYNVHVHVLYMCMGWWCIGFHSPLIPYSGYFRGELFVIFVVKRRTTNFFTHETVPHSTGVWFSILTTMKIFHKLAKNLLLTKILPHKKYPLYGNIPEPFHMYMYTCIRVHVHYFCWHCAYVCTCTLYTQHVHVHVHVHVQATRAQYLL